MPEFKLEIHTPDREVRSVEAPVDMKTRDFLQDLLESLDIKEEGWILHDKDLARDLGLEQSLADNGVREGHHLYFKRNIPPPPPPRRPFPNWIWLALLFAALLLAAPAGFIVGKNTRQAEVMDLNGKVAALQAQLATKSNPDPKLESMGSDLAARTAQVQDLNQKLEAASKEASGLRSQQKDMKAQQIQLIRQLTDAQALAAQAKTHADQLQQQLTQAQATQSSAAQANAALQRAQAQVFELQRRIQVLESTTPAPVAKAPRWGFIVWTGKLGSGDHVTITGGHAQSGELRGTLPSVPCEVSPVYNEGLVVTGFPDLQNKLTRLEFYAPKKGTFVAVFSWVIR